MTDQKRPYKMKRRAELERATRERMADGRVDAPARTTPHPSLRHERSARGLEVVAIPAEETRDRR